MIFTMIESKITKITSSGLRILTIVWMACTETEEAVKYVIRLCDGRFGCISIVST